MVLRPGGVFVGSDGTDTEARRRLHVDDTFVPIDPGTLAGRLERAGFGEVTVEATAERFRCSTVAGA